MNQRAGRVLSGANEKKLLSALEAIQEVLAQLVDNEDRAASGVTACLRSYPMQAIEVRAEADAPTLISGYAAVFNSLSVDMGGWREQILPGAFAESLKIADVRALWQHDSTRPLGRTGNGTLRVWEDERGLAFELTPPDTQDGRDAVELLRRGDIDQMSFGFAVAAEGDSWQPLEDRTLLHTLRKVELYEVSFVTWPAYPATSAALMRNAPEWVRRALQSGSETDSEPADRRALESEFAWLKLCELTGG